MESSWVRAIVFDVYGICRLSRNEASVRSEMANAVFRYWIRVVRWRELAEYIAMPST